MNARKQLVELVPLNIDEEMQCAWLLEQVHGRIQLSFHACHAHKHTAHANAL